MSASPSLNPQGDTKISIKYHPGSVQYFTEQLSNQVSMQMMLILGGEFTMGAPETELDSEASERPQHKVTVPTFFMGKYPITQEQWRIVAEFSQITRKLDLYPSEFKGDERPVEQINWYEAKEFCDRLSNYTNRKYRLPTEAEWEYACRAGTTTPFHFGETITTDLANYRGTDRKSDFYNWSGSYGEGSKGEYRQETIPVDKFGIANGFGLCGMHGNVLEWCEDNWHSNYEDAPQDGSAWFKQETNNKVLRGGSWFKHPHRCRSAMRYHENPEFGYNESGFRVVCMMPVQ